MPEQGRVGDVAFSASDGHGCPSCSHPVSGPAIAGSPNVLVNGLAALREKDPGIHAACCGPNRWTASGGAPYVLINQRAAFRVGDPSSHCGGQGKLIIGSKNVYVGNKGGARPRKPTGSAWIDIILRDEDGRPVPGEAYRVELSDGGIVEGRLDSNGFAHISEIPSGNCHVTFTRLDQDSWIAE